MAGTAKEQAEAQEQQARLEAVVAEVTQQAQEAAAGILAQAQAQAAELMAAAQQAAAAAQQPAAGGVDLEQFATSIQQAAGRTKVWGPDEVEEGFTPVKFRSKGELRVVRVPRHRFTAANGEAQTSPGVAYDFGYDHSFVALSSDVADYIRARPAFNLEVWEVGKEPNRVPDPEAVFDRINQAIADVDDDTLIEIESEEMAGHKREVVLKQVKSARATVQRMVVA